jgi:diguanylate cyclase
MSVSFVFDALAAARGEPDLCRDLADAEALRLADRVRELDVENARLRADVERLAAMEQTVAVLLDRVMREPLTGALSRDGLRCVFDAAAESGRLTGLLLLDLDGFKNVNDALGHPAGDQVLRAVAVRLRAWRQLAVSRHGGDEFALLVRDADPVVAAGWVAALVAAPIDVGGACVRVTASVGIAPVDGNAGLSELLQRADQAMYQAKRSQGRRPVVWDGDSK